MVGGLLKRWSVKPVPMYEYRCPICNNQMELELSMEHDLVRCNDCNALANRIYSAPGIVFKGKGFYKTGG